MSEAINKAEALRAEAIRTLLAERQAIDHALASLSYRDGDANPSTPPAIKKSHKKKATDEIAVAQPVTPSI